jgi:hypothetical protein
MPEDETFEALAGIHDMVSDIQALSTNLERIIANPHLFTEEQMVEQMTYAKVVIDACVFGSQVMSNSDHELHDETKDLINTIMQ